MLLRAGVIGFLLAVLSWWGAGCGPAAGPPPANGGDGGGVDGAVPPDGARDTAVDAPAAPAADGGGEVDAGPDGPVAPPGSVLLITPADLTIAVAPGAQAGVDYRVTLRTAGTYDLDVTGEAALTVDDATLGGFTGAHFTGALGASGTTVVRAAARGLTAQTSLTLAVQSVVLAPGVAADAPAKFGGASGGAAPTIIYPADGILVPPNLNVFEFHFLPGAGNTLFNLSFHQGALAVDFYFGCTSVGGGCVYAPDQAAWAVLAETMRGRDAVSYTLRGVNGASPGAVGTSAAQTIRFADLDIHGGIYYWNAGAGLIKRYEFGVSGQTAETYLNKAQAGAMTCVGCHVISTDGKRIAAGNDIPGPAAYKVYDVATRTPYFSQGLLSGANFFSFSPDATQIMTSSGSSIVLRDATTGAAQNPNPLVGNGAMPDWAPDGARMVFARPQTALPFGADGVVNASLMIMSKNGASWGAPATLVPYAGANLNNYYPTFSPDGSWVLFNRCATCTSDTSTTGSSYSAPDAEVWVVSAAGGTPLKLARASTGECDSWPKWAPVVQRYRGQPVMWLTFASKRAYGLRLAAGAQSQLWMVAFDPAAAAAGQDPGYPAFWLPFQELTSGNHIAQWATVVERQPCTSNSQCQAGELCEDGRCYPSGATHH
jgi:hypothetical protein